MIRYLKFESKKELRAIAERNAKTVDEAFSVFSFLKPGIGDLRSIPEMERSALLQELGWRAMRRGAIETIRSVENDAWFWTTFNGVELWLPGFTLKTMHHCIAASQENGLKLWVETRHWAALRDQLSDGSLFLDVGAATGAMTVPFAKTLLGARIVAFEPSSRTREFLEKTLAKNSISGVTVLPFALSDAAGSATFIEYPEDSTGVTPFLPEASRLQASNDDQVPGTTTYPVSVRTLDSLASELAFQSYSKIVIKIDVEGFEAHVLRGAEETLRKYRPFLSIDIHHKLGGSGMTDGDVIAILNAHNYQIERMDHVIIAR